MSKPSDTSFSLMPCHCGPLDLVASAVPGAFLVDALATQYSTAWVLAGGLVSGLALPNLMPVPESAQYPLMGFGVGYFISRGYSKQPILLSCLIGLGSAWVFAKFLAPHVKRARDFYGNTGWGRSGSPEGDVYLTHHPTPTAGQGFPGPFENYGPLAFDYIPI